MRQCYQYGGIYKSHSTAWALLIKVHSGYIWLSVLVALLLPRCYFSVLKFTYTCIYIYVWITHNESFYAPSLFIFECNIHLYTFWLHTDTMNQIAIACYTHMHLLYVWSSTAVMRWNESSIWRPILILLNNLTIYRQLTKWPIEVKLHVQWSFSYF